MEDQLADVMRIQTFLAALRQTGNLDQAQALAGIDSETYHHWLSTQPNFEKLVGEQKRFFESVTLGAKENISTDVLNAVRRLLTGQNKMVKKTVRRSYSVDENGEKKLVGETVEVVERNDPIDSRLVQHFLPLLEQSMKGSSNLVDSAAQQALGNVADHAGEQQMLLSLIGSLQGELDINQAIEDGSVLEELRNVGIDEEGS